MSLIWLYTKGQGFSTAQRKTRKCSVFASQHGFESHTWLRCWPLGMSKKIPGARKKIHCSAEQRQMSWDSKDE